MVKVSLAFALQFVYASAVENWPRSRLEGVGRRDNRGGLWGRGLRRLWAVAGGSCRPEGFDGHVWESASRPNESESIPELFQGLLRSAMCTSVMRKLRILPLPVLAIVAVSVPALAAEEGDPKLGRELYVEYCLQCHGGRGEGWGWAKKIPPPPVPIPDLSNQELMIRLSNQYLFDIIKGGGEAVGKTRLMPPAGRVMSDEAIWDVIAYLRSLSQSAQGPKEKER